MNNDNRAKSPTLRANTRKFARACAILVAACSILTVARATTITFEELPAGLVAMNNSPGAVVSAGSQLSNQYLASQGVVFTSLGGFAALVIHGPGNPTASAPNIIGGTGANGTLDYSAPITISFFDPTIPGVAAVASSFMIQGDWVPLGSGTVFATAYDVAGNIIGTTSDTDDKVFGVSGPVLQFSQAGIHSVKIWGDSATVGFDQLQFQLELQTTTTVADGGNSLALLGLGVGLVLTARRGPQKPRHKSA